LRFLDSYHENLESKLGKLQNELLSPIRIYIEELLKIKMPTHYDLTTTELTKETRDYLYNYFNNLVINRILFFLWNFLQSNWNLVALESLAGTMKSTSLALSLIKNRIKIEEAFKLSRIEEDYQANLFGKVTIFKWF